MDDNSVTPDEPLVKLQKQLATDYVNWIAANHEHSNNPCFANSQKLWLATSLLISQLADIIDASPYSGLGGIIGQPLRLAAIGIFQSLSGRAPEVFRPKRRRGGQPRGPVRELFKSAVVAYVQLCKKKNGRFIPDKEPLLTIETILGVKETTFEEWEDKADTKEAIAMWKNILSPIQDENERLAAAKAYLRLGGQFPGYIG
jgi:hypothetical protein